MYTRAAEIEVLIVDHDFIPPRVSINLGDTVVWIATTPEHTVSADGGAFDSTGVFDTIPEGETYSVTFTKPGTYPYFCLTHGGPRGTGMSGVITVLASATNQKPATPSNRSPASNADWQPLRPLLETSSFQDADQGDYHTASQWLIRRTDTEQSIFDSGEDRVNLDRFLAPTLAPTTRYAWQVRYLDSRGAWSEYSVATSFQTVPLIQAAGNGLLAAYFNGPQLDVPRVTATNGMIQFAWKDSPPHRRITAPIFAIRWTGALLPEFSEIYRLELDVKGSVRLWVDDQLAIDSFQSCSFQRDLSTSLRFGAGRLVPIRLEYVADAVEPSISFRWSSFSRSREIVPSVRLFSSGTLKEIP